MSSEIKFEEHNVPRENITNGRVKVTDLISRLNEVKKKERKSNLVLSVAAISAVTAFGIILSL